MSKKSLSPGEAAVLVLRRTLEQGLAESASKTPDASPDVVIAVDITRNGKDSRFVPVSPGVFALRASQVALTAVPADAADINEPEHRMRVPLLPLYSEVRALLRIWADRPRSSVTHLRHTMGDLRGTLQDPVDWTSPDEWIPERLKGEDRELALAIWNDSKEQVDPRHIYGVDESDNVHRKAIRAH